ncbi:MAG: hypothetical protein ACQGVK_10875 [Myxococcota bacterium]
MLAFAGSLLLLMPAVAWAESLVVIVHVDRNVALDREAVAQIFLKRRRLWSDGGAVIPVNRTADSEARHIFEKLVFGEGARSRLSSFWHRAYFRGVLPPATLASDRAVLRFVASEPRAIGYVPRSRLDASVRAVLVLEERRSEAHRTPASP